MSEAASNCSDGGGDIEGFAESRQGMGESVFVERTHIVFAGERALTQDA
jgi:hypothetical protein